MAPNIYHFGSGDGFEEQLSCKWQSNNSDKLVLYHPLTASECRAVPDWTKLDELVAHLWELQAQRCRLLNKPHGSTDGEIKARGQTLDILESVLAGKRGHCGSRKIERKRQQSEGGCGCVVQ